MHSKSAQMLKHFTVATVTNKTVVKVAGLIGLSLASMVVDEAIGLIKRYVWRNYVTELEVSSSDKCYNWLLHWIAKHNQQLLHFSVTTVNQNTESAHATSKFDYEPNAGEHIFK